MYTLAEQLLGHVMASLAACGRPEPKHCGVVPGGEFSPSKCCEGHAWTRVLPAQPLVAAIVAPNPCAEMGWQVTIEAGVARCPAPAPRGGMGSIAYPSAADLDKAARGQYADAVALGAGIAAAVAAWRDDDPEDPGGPFDNMDAAVGGLSWLNTATCLGVTGQARVQLVGVCCDMTPDAPLVPPIAAT